MPDETTVMRAALAKFMGVNLDENQTRIDGKRLLPFTDDKLPVPAVLMEYAAEESIAPLVAVRDGDFEFIHGPVDPPQLFDLASDPDEMQYLASDPVYAEKWRISPIL